MIDSKTTKANKPLAVNTRLLLGFRFEEVRFWREHASICQHYPGAGSKRYREIFDEYFTGKRNKLGLIPRQIICHSERCGVAGVLTRCRRRMRSYGSSRRYSARRRFESAGV